MSIRKVNAIITMKFKTILKNPTILLGPIMSMGFVLLYKSVMPVDKGSNDFAAYLLQLGVIFNVLMTGIMATSMPLAEEKEKNTLRVLMTSSVNGAEFFIGSLVPVLLIMVAVNAVMVPLSGVESINMIVYMLVTTAASIITMILGMIVGLVTKNQMSSSFASTPLLLILMMIPMLAGMNENMEKMSKYIYTGSLNNIITNLVNKADVLVSSQQMIIFAVWLLIAIAAFLLFYKKNGLETD